MLVFASLVVLGHVDWPRQVVSAELRLLRSSWIVFPLFVVN
jgi:hypothetical protein